MAEFSKQSRPIRIMNISGSPSDRRDALVKNLASGEPIDVFVGDWMSELNMPLRAYEVTNGMSVGYEPSFLESLEPSLELLAARQAKLISNAGAVATKDLYDKVVSMVSDRGLNLTVAWLEGDVVLDTFNKLQADGADFTHLTTGQPLKDWPFEPIFAQCYLGGMGIVKALEAGADIVICGRVADASPIVGAAAWWHGWSRTEYDKLAMSLMAGHLIECSVYVTGGDFSGFKSLDFNKIHDMGYPIAEIASSGEVIITKREGTGGFVTVETCKEQLLYEIQGSLYLNCDVTAVIDQAKFTEVAKDRIQLSNITGMPPPRTTKVGITAHGGYQSELHFSAIGLDIEEKVQMLDILVRDSLGADALAKLTRFEITSYGSVPVSPRNQNSALVDVRVFGEAREQEAVDATNFASKVLNVIMHSYPAMTPHPNRRASAPRAVQEYFPCLIPQPTVTVHFSNPDMAAVEALPPDTTIDHPPWQPSYETESPVPLHTFGPTTRAPLGYTVYARAGDKGSNCNVGFFVRTEAEWPWLRSLLSTAKFIELMEDDYRGQKIDRMEFRNLWAVHFLLHDHLDRGVCATSTYDVLGKFIAEYMRCKPVDIPNRFLEQGRI